MLHWEDRFFDEPINRLKSVVNGTGYNRIVYVEHSWKQLKYSVEWYEKQCGLASFKEDVILREIDLQRISGSSNSPFERKDLLYLNNHVKEPIESVDYSKNLSPVLIYEKLNKEVPYILSIDPAEGLSLDNNAFMLINPYTQLPAAEFKSPYISPPDFTKMIIKFMDERCPKSMIVVEANRGREIINRILESKYRYQLWYDVDKLNAKIVETTDGYGAQRQAANVRRAYGFDTTKSSRPKLFAILENFVVEEKDKLCTKYLVDDIVGLIRKTSGRIEAGSGKNDDNVMAYLIGMYIYFHATNLEDYGIVRGATEPINDDPNDPSALREKIASMMSILPDNMKAMFSEFIGEKNPVDASWEYERELQREMINSPSLNSDNENISLNEYNDSYWDQADNDIFDSNFNKSHHDVNIEDLF